MNKQEAIKRIEQMGEYERFVDEPISKASVLSIISQIHEPQKVAVPKFVAEWIEEHKAQFSNLYTVYSWLGQQKNQVSEWVNSNIDIFARAWLDGFEIEQEKLYTVEIPNPHVNAYTVLQKQMDNIVLVGTPKNSGWRDWEASQLTESEIKQDFEWAWDAGFAKEVE